MTDEDGEDQEDGAGDELDEDDFHSNGSFLFSPIFSSSPHVLTSLNFPDGWTELSPPIVLPMVAASTPNFSSPLNVASQVYQGVVPPSVPVCKLVILCVRL